MKKKKITILLQYICDGNLESLDKIILRVKKNLNEIICGFGKTDIRPSI